MTSTSEVKIPLPQYLKLLTTANLPVAKAMSTAGKIYKDYARPSQLSTLTDTKLKAAGIDDAADRKLVLSAFRKAGYGSKRTALKRKKEDLDGAGSVEKLQTIDPTAEAGPSRPPSRMTDVEAVITPTKRRKRLFEKNEFLPEGPPEEVEHRGGLEFDEVLDERILQHKYTIVNRAPVMTAWATVVAERLNFKRDEALSIASVYTEMNAVSKGISLGMYDKSKEQGLEASRKGVQPYVELMGRSPVYRTHDEHWRALSNGEPVSPLTAFGYISRSFRQNVPCVIGAMRLLAESYSPTELNSKAWVLYAEFRPEVDQWGKRSQLSCFKILSLRKTQSSNQGTSHQGTSLPQVDPSIRNLESDHQTLLPTSPRDFPRKPSQLSLEEYEAALDQDHTFDEVDLSSVGQAVS